MRFTIVSSLTSLLLVGRSLATDTLDTCSPTEATTCNCPTNPIRRWQSREYNFPEHLFPRTNPTCPDGTTSCCTSTGPGPLKVSDSTSTTDLQCGSNFGDDQQDVSGGVTYKIEDCPPTYPGQKCLHISITTASGVTVKDIHLQVDDDVITKNTQLGQWDFNSYCTETPTECWVPVDKIIATFENPSTTTLCGKTVYVAAGISVDFTNAPSDATCFNRGTTIGSGNWFMYWTLNLECPDICLHNCCCPTITPPPPTTKFCSIGTAFGYGSGAINLNGNPVGPALGGKGCNRWGWYFKVDKATLTQGLSGTLIVGAGGNDVNKGTPVGTWSAQLIGSNVVFTYTLYNDDAKGHFDLSEVHVYASCSTPDQCAPGQYTYVFPTGTLTGTSDTSYSGSFAVPSCSSYYLIFHAKVNQQFPATATCPTEVQ